MLQNPPPADPNLHPSIQAAQSWVAKSGHHILQEYARLLSIPNHASDYVNIRANADLLENMFAQRGFEMQQLVLGDAPPIVFGEKRATNAQRTLCFYAHYDGQPAQPHNWTHPPFQPTLYDGPVEHGGRPIQLPQEGESISWDWRLYARSAADDKAPIMALAAAVDALDAAGLAQTSNIKLFFDGEEETGSPHIEQYLEQYGDLLADIDAWLLVDGAIYANGYPSFEFGSRGMAGLQLTVYGATRSLHSGHYGNWAPVPGQHLAHLLASMKSENGRVLIDGFYDSDIPLTSFELDQIAQSPNLEAQLKAELGLADTESFGETIQQSIMRPSLTIRGVASGAVGPEMRNVIPNTAIAELGMRLVHGNDPNHMMDLVEAHIGQQGWHIVRQDPDLETRQQHPKIIKVLRDENAFPAAKASMEEPIIRPILEGLRQFTGNQGVVLPAIGASNRIYGLIFNRLNKPGVCITLVNRDNNQHAADENVRIGNIFYGIEMLAFLLALPSNL